MMERRSAVGVLQPAPPDPSIDGSRYADATIVAIHVPFAAAHNPAQATCIYKVFRGTLRSRQAPIGENLCGAKNRQSLSAGRCIDAVIPASGFAESGQEMGAADPAGSNCAPSRNRSAPMEIGTGAADSDHAPE